jgi:hypothetical protein
MSEPLVLSFDVECSAAHAFTTWTARIDAWWPSDHTVSGDSAAQIVLEPGIGGRIFERAPDGREHEWGQVVRWDPPTDLAYLWHLGGTSESATHVAIHFLAVGAQTTRVEIEHTGWERLRPDGDTWRDRNQAGWATLLPHFQTSIEKENA